MVLLVALWLSAVWTALAAAPSMATCVAPDGAQGCFSSIQAAVDAVAPGGTILIAAGTYSESVAVSKVVVVQGGWQPAGTTLTRTVVTAAGARCALDLNGGGGAYRDLTLSGAAEAGLCGIMVGNLTLERITARDNALDGASLLVGAQVTVTHFVGEQNGRDGMAYLCLGSSGTVVNVVDSVWRNNGRHGLSGGFSCENQVLRSRFEGNGGSGLEGFGGPCPIRDAARITESVLAENIIRNNQVGIDRVCGGQLTLRRNWISGNVTGTRSVGQGVIASENNLFVDNSSAAWLVEGDVQVSSVNDTMANHPAAAFALRADPNDCARRPDLQVRNGIIWSTPADFLGWNDAACAGQPAYRVAVSYTLMVTPALYSGDPDVTLGLGIIDLAPGFVGDGSYRPVVGSAGVDAGFNGGAPAVDYAGTPRPLDGNVDGVATTDLGAYEYAPRRWLFPVAKYEG